MDDSLDDLQLHQPFSLRSLFQSRRRLVLLFFSALCVTAVLTLYRHTGISSDTTTVPLPDIRPYPSRSSFYARCYSVSFALNGTIIYAPVRFIVGGVGPIPKAKGEAIHQDSINNEAIHQDEINHKAINEDDIGVDYEYACMPRFLILRPPQSTKDIQELLLPLLEADQSLRIQADAIPIDPIIEGHDVRSAKRLDEGYRPIISPITHTSYELQDYLPAWPTMPRPGMHGNVDILEEHFTSPIAFSRARTLMGPFTHFIVWLRNPIHLAYAIYQANVDSDPNASSFDNFVTYALELLPSTTVQDADLDARPAWISELPDLVQKAIVSGMYDIHLAQWGREFASTNFLIAQEEAVIEDSSLLQDELQRFIHKGYGVPGRPVSIPNARSLPHRAQPPTQISKPFERMRPIMNDATRAQLAHLYRPHIARLKEKWQNLLPSNWVEWQLE